MTAAKFRWRSPSMLPNRSARIDFTGTSPQQPNNFNAPLAICKAVVLYVFRTLVEDDIPLNAGCLKPLEIIVPEGCMLNPQYPAAVVAGNVETSQAIANALYGALGVLAAESRHHEQLHLRQRSVPILRNHLRRLRCRSDLRRHGCYTNPHDQLAPHRSRSAGMALPRLARKLCHSSPQWRGGAAFRRQWRNSPHPLLRTYDCYGLVRTPKLYRLLVCKAANREPWGGTFWSERGRSCL